MIAAGLYDLVGLRFPIETEDGETDIGLVTAVAGWSPQYVLVQTSRGQTCRLGAHLLRHLDPLPTTRGEPEMAIATAASKKSQSSRKSSKSSAPKKAPDWKSFPNAEKLEFLLGKTTIPDSAHTTKKRHKGETRPDFLGRIYGA